jgi:hypothetical protein
VLTNTWRQDQVLVYRINGHGSNDLFKTLENIRPFILLNSVKTKASVANRIPEEDDDLRLTQLQATQYFSKRAMKLHGNYLEVSYTRSYINALFPYKFLYHTHFARYLLTPWSRVLLEKLTGSAASQEIPRILRTRRFLTVLTSGRQHSLSCANSIQSPQPPSTS